MSAAILILNVVALVYLWTIAQDVRAVREKVEDWPK